MTYAEAARNFTAVQRKRSILLLLAELRAPCPAAIWILFIVQRSMTLCIAASAVSDIAAPVGRFLLHLAAPWGGPFLSRQVSMILLLNLAADMTLLALESQTIIGIRLARLSLGGPAAMVEAERMVSEKVLALGEAATTLVTGGSAHDVVRGYRRHVQANAQRLTG
jgi:hypothetical protein